MTLHVDHGRMRRAAVELHRASVDLSDERSRADARVSGLLDGGWRGRSATAYQEAWTHWREGCDEVVRGLAAMADLLAAVERDVTERDDESQQHLDAVAARIVERLS